MIGKIIGALTGVSVQTWLVLGAVALFATYSGTIFVWGRNYQERIDDAKALRLKVEQQAAVIAENTRQQLAANAIQAGDATRAAIAEGDLRDLRKRILETPPDTASDNGGLSLPRVERVRNFRRYTPIRPTKRTADPG